MIDIESKIISCREDTNDYRLCLTREEIEEINKALTKREPSEWEKAHELIKAYNDGVEKGKAEAIEECIQIVQKIKDDYDDAKFQVLSSRLVQCLSVVRLISLRQEQSF